MNPFKQVALYQMYKKSISAEIEQLRRPSDGEPKERRSPEDCFDFLVLPYPKPITDEEAIQLPVLYNNKVNEKFLHLLRSYRRASMGVFRNTNEPTEAQHQAYGVVDFLMEYYMHVGGLYAELYRFHEYISTKTNLMLEKNYIDPQVRSILEEFRTATKPNHLSILQCYGIICSSFREFVADALDGAVRVGTPVSQRKK